MTIRFNCYECGRLISVPDEAAGRRGRCPDCNSMQPVPKKSTATGGTGAGTAAGAGTGVARRVKSGGRKPVTGANRLGVKPGPARKQETIIETAEIVPGIDNDDDDDDHLPPVELDDDLRGLIDAPDDDAPAAAGTWGGGKKTGRVEPATRVALTAGEKRTMARQAQRDAIAEMKKKQGGSRAFLWVVFGLLLIVGHTAGAMLLGAAVTLAWAEKPADVPWFDVPAGILGVQERVDKLRENGGTGTSGPADNSGASVNGD